MAAKRRTSRGRSSARAIRAIFAASSAQYAVASRVFIGEWVRKLVSEGRHSQSP